MARRKESRMADDQQEEASSGANHQVPTTPAVVTWTVFCNTWYNKHEKILSHQGDEHDLDKLTWWTQ